MGNSYSKGRTNRSQHFFTFTSKIL